MSEAILEKLKEIYESLADEQKKEVEACNSAEELIQFAEKEGIDLPEEVRDYLLEADNEDASELSLDELDPVAGGHFMYRKFAEIYRVVTGRRYDQDEVRHLRAKAAANKQEG